MEQSLQNKTTKRTETNGIAQLHCSQFHYCQREEEQEEEAGAEEEEEEEEEGGRGAGRSVTLLQDA